MSCSSTKEGSFIHLVNERGYAVERLGFKAYFSTSPEITAGDLPISSFQNLEIPANGSIQFQLPIDPSFSGTMFLILTSFEGSSTGSTQSKVLQFEFNLGQVADVKVYDGNSFAFSVFLLFTLMTSFFVGIFILLRKHSEGKTWSLQKERQDKASIRNLISNGRLETALEKLYNKALEHDAELKKDATLLRSQLNANRHDISMGLIAQQDYLLCQNRLTLAAICLLDQLMPD